MTTEEKIEAFKEHVGKYLLNIAKVLSDHFRVDAPGGPPDPLRDSGYAILSIGLSYFEMIGQYVSGKSSDIKEKSGLSSTKAFEIGFGRVYPSGIPGVDPGRVYDLLRCGMYHTGVPKGGGLSRHPKNAFQIENGDLLINPAQMIDDLIAHFSKFCQELESGVDKQLLINFENMFGSLTGPGTTLTTSSSGSTTDTTTKSETPKTEPYYRNSGSSGAVPPNPT